MSTAKDDGKGAGRQPPGHLPPVQKLRQKDKVHSTVQQKAKTTVQVPHNASGANAVPIGAKINGQLPPPPPVHGPWNKPQTLQTVFNVPLQWHQ